MQVSISWPRRRKVFSHFYYHSNKSQGLTTLTFYRFYLIIFLIGFQHQTLPFPLDHHQSIQCQCWGHWWGCCWQKSTLSTWSSGTQRMQTMHRCLLCKRPDGFLLLETFSLIWQLIFHCKWKRWTDLFLLRRLLDSQITIGSIQELSALVSPSSSLHYYFYVNSLKSIKNIWEARSRVLFVWLLDLEKHLLVKLRITFNWNTKVPVYQTSFIAARSDRSCRQNSSLCHWGVH